MLRYLYMAPTLVAIIIFLYMRFLKKKRLDKRRQRFQKLKEKLMQNVKNNRQTNETIKT